MPNLRYNWIMKILDKEIQKTDLANCKNVLDGAMVKGVVDVEKKLLGIDAEMHADIEQLFLEKGSNQDNLWGINLWFEEAGDDFIEFDSMINIRPRQGNRSRDIESPEIRKKIEQVVTKWIK